MIHYSSVIIPLAVLIPNLLWYIFPPDTSPQEDAGNAPAVPLFCENVGRIGVFFIPLFYQIELNSIENKICLFLMVVALLIYYFGWLRYFTNKREHALLFKPLWIMPIPMAIMPVAYFILAAKILNSIPLLVAALSLAFGHLIISYKEYQNLKNICSKLNILP